jgi:hypothetical protein
VNGMQRLKAEVVALSEAGLSHLEIAQRLGVSRLRVDALMRRPRTFAPRRCELCGSVFTPTGSRQRFCTPEHREQHHRREPTPRACLICGKEFMPTNGRQRLCSAEHRELHAVPRTIREARERVQALEAELARMRDQLAEREAA